MNENLLKNNLKLSSDTNTNEREFVPIISLMNCIESELFPPDIQFINDIDVNSFKFTGLFNESIPYSLNEKSYPSDDNILPNLPS